MKVKIYRLLQDDRRHPLLLPQVVWQQALSQIGERFAVPSMWQTDVARPLASSLEQALDGPLRGVEGEEQLSQAARLFATARVGVLVAVAQ